MKSAATGHAVIYVDQADPVTTLDGVPGGWANQPVTVTARATDATSGMGGGAFTAIRIDGGAPQTAPGGEVSATAIGEGVHTIAYYARDAAGNANDGGSANGVANEAPATATVRIDRGPPQVAFANFQSPLDPEAIEVRVADSLSGAGPLAGAGRGAPRRHDRPVRAAAGRGGGRPAGRPLGLRRLPGGRVRVPRDRPRRGGQRGHHHAARQRARRWRWPTR